MSKPASAPPRIVPRTDASHNGAETERWADLLSRCGSPGLPPPSTLRGKRVLITGCGGSIGSALSQAAADSECSSLVLLDSSESALYELDRSIHRSGFSSHIPVLASICNPGMIAQIFAQHAPQIVLHAAALKHVPLMEQNPFAAVETNVLGTLNLIEAALKHRVEHLLLVSTDKAVAPHSIMGASKRVAELLMLTHGTDFTRLTALRLCNVIGSQGSVLPLFMDQLARGLPLPVTHPEVSRYFITLEHATNALLCALRSPAAASILIPEVTSQLRILDLAHHLMQTRSASSTVEFTGLRPGDKLCEQLLSDAEQRSERPAIDSPNLYAVEGPSPSRAMLLRTVVELSAAIHAWDLPSLLIAIREIVPDYRPSAALLNSQPASQVHA